MQGCAELWEVCGAESEDEKARMDLDGRMTRKRREGRAHQSKTVLTGERTWSRHNSRSVGISTDWFPYLPMLSRLKVGGFSPLDVYSSNRPQMQIYYTPRAVKTQSCWYLGLTYLSASASSHPTACSMSIWPPTPSGVSHVMPR